MYIAPITAHLHVVLQVVDQEAHVGPELPDSPQLPRPLPVLHEEGPALLEGHLCPTQDQKEPEKAIVPEEDGGRVHFVRLTVNKNTFK